MSILKAAVHSRTARVGVALSLASAALIGFANHADAAVTGTVSPNYGAAGATKVVNFTASGFKTAAGTSLVYTENNGVQFQVGTKCATAPATPAAGTIVNVDAGLTRRIVSATKLTITVPNTLSIGTSISKAFQLCVYANAGSHALIASGKYTVYGVPTVTAVSPDSGSVQGGDTIEVTGTNFTSTGLTATVGGTALTNIVVAATGTSFTAKTPAHVEGTNVQVAVTTLGGTSSNAVGDDFDYVNAITVEPKTGKNQTVTTLTITGVGFTDTDLDFSGTSAVLFVDGAYDGADDGDGARTNAEVDTCANVQVVSDTELICDTPNNAALDDHAWTVAIVDDTTMDAVLAYSTVVSSGATFTFSDF